MCYYGKIRRNIIASQQLIDIIKDEISLNVLNDLLEKARDLATSQSFLDIEKRLLMDDVKLLGLKPAEFSKIVKYKLNEELLMNELTTLELINDHLMDNLID